MSSYIDVNSFYRNRQNNPQPSDYLIKYDNTEESKYPTSPTTEYLPYNNVLLGTNPVLTLTSPAGTVYYSLALDTNNSNLLDSSTNLYAFCPPPLSKDIYVGSFIDFPQSTVAGNYYPISGYIPATSTTAALILVNATGLPALTNIILTNQAALIRKEKPVVIVNNSVISSNGRVITVAGAANISLVTSIISSDSPGFYGIRVYKVGNPFTDSTLLNLINQASLVNNWNSATGVLTLNSTVTQFVAPILLEVFTVMEGYKNITYMGNQINQATNNKSRLAQVTLPNIEFINGNGGRLDSYPFIYAAVIQSGKSTSTNYLYSNGKSISQAVGRLKISADNYNGITSFYGLACLEKPLITFRPTNDITLRFMFPNGNVIRYRLPDNGIIYPPNPLLQTSLYFELIKQ